MKSCLHEGNRCPPSTGCFLPVRREDGWLDFAPMKNPPSCFVRAALGFVMTCAVLASATAREWTSSDGKKLEAELISVTGDAVVLKRAVDGREFTLPLTRLSEADREWVRTQSATPPTPSGAPTAAGAPKAVAGPYAGLVTGDWALSTFKNLPFSLYAAKDLDASKTYPLIVALHGKSTNNENGKQVGGWMKTFAKPERYKKHPCIIIAPLCYQPFGGTGGGWSDKPGDEVIGLIKDLLKTLPVDKERIYVMGHSMGGFGTCHLMGKEPRLFAAGIPVSGSSGDTGALKRLPLWLFHAADDDVVKVDGARSLAKALDKSKTFKYTEYPDGGHGIPGKVFDDDAVHEWLFAQGGKK